MEKFKILITENLQKVINVEAEYVNEACEKVEEMVNGSEIILTADDFTTRNIELYEDE